MITSIISDGRLNDSGPNAARVNIQICNEIFVINVIMQHRCVGILAGRNVTFSTRYPG